MIFESMLKGFFSKEKEENITLNDPTKIIDALGSEIDISELVDSNYSNYNTTAKQKELTNAQLIKNYRKLANSPEAFVVVDEIVNEFYSGVYNDLPKLRIQDTDISEKLNKVINDAFEKILNIIDFRTNGSSLFKRWYVDGHLFLECVYDENSLKKGLKHIGVLDPTYMTRVYDEKNKKYVYRYTNSNYGYFGGSLDKTDYVEEQLVYINSGLTDENGKPIGYLHPAVKLNNQITLIEDMIVVYRITRGTDKRSIKVNVGNMPKTKAVTYMTELVNKFKYKKSYNNETGTIENNSHIMAVTEDIWLPTKNSTKDIEIDTLQGGQNLGELGDLEYFRSKLMHVLRVPSGRFNQDNSFDISATEINREEMRFTQFISGMRLKFNELFKELLKRELISTNSMTEQEYFDIRKHINIYYPGESVLIKKQFNAELKNRLDLLEQMEQYIGKYYSDEFIRKVILDMSDEEIKDMKEQIKNETLATDGGDSDFKLSDYVDDDSEQPEESKNESFY